MTDEQLLAVFELWARAGGHCSEPGYQFDGWRVRVDRGGAYVGRAAYGGSVLRKHAPSTACLFAACVEHGGSVDVGACPECAKRGGGWEWCMRLHIDGLQMQWADGTPTRPASSRLDSMKSRKFLETEGWAVVYADMTDTPACQRASRPCPACAVDGKPTGRERRELAQLLLDSLPAWEPSGAWTVREADGTEHPYGGWGCTVLLPRNVEARERLAVEADRLQEQVEPCGFCEGRRFTYAVDSCGDGKPPTHPRRVKCIACDGVGVDEYGEAKRLLGELLALHLAGKLETRAADLPGLMGLRGCPAPGCESGRQLLRDGHNVPTGALRDCWTCRGAGWAAA